MFNIKPKQMKLKFIELMPKEGIVCDERLTPFKLGNNTCFQFRAEGQLFLAIQLPLRKSTDWFAVFKNLSGKRVFNEDVADYAQNILDVYCAGRKMESDQSNPEDFHRDCFTIVGYDREWTYAVIKANVKHMSILLQGAGDKDLEGCEKAAWNDLKSEYLSMKFAYEAFTGRWPEREFANSDIKALEKELRGLCPEAKFKTSQKMGGRKGFTMKMNRVWFFYEGTDGKVGVSYEDMFDLGTGEQKDFQSGSFSPMAIAALDDQIAFLSRGSRLAHINKLVAAEAKRRRFRNSCLYLGAEED